MPRFPPATIAVLKRRLLAKAGDGYRFATDDDGAEVAAVAAEAGLTPAQVKQWVVDVHDYYPMPSRRDDFLQNTKVKTILLYLFLYIKRCNVKNSLPQFPS